MYDCAVLSKGSTWWVMELFVETATQRMVALDPGELVDGSSLAWFLVSQQ